MKMALKSTDGRDDHGWPSCRDQAHLIPQCIYLMSLAFGHASREQLVNGIDFVLIELLLIDHSLVPIPFFLVLIFLLAISFSFELSDLSPR